MYYSSEFDHPIEEVGQPEDNYTPPPTRSVKSLHELIHGKKSSFEVTTPVESIERINPDQFVTNSILINSQDDEEEMPSSSLTVLPDESDLMNLLGINDIPLQSPSRYQQNHSKEDDLIELYSVIGMLRKENEELKKDNEFTKKSKDAIITDLTSKYESQISKLKNDLKLTNQKNIDQVLEFQEIRLEYDEMKNEIDRLLQERDTLENRLGQDKDDQSSVKADLMNSKTEINKLRMEIARYKNDSEMLNREVSDLKTEISRIKSEADKFVDKLEKDNEDQRLFITRLEDQIAPLKNEVTEKHQMNLKLSSELNNLDRNLNIEINENAMLKAKVNQLELSDKELQQAKFHISNLEMKCREMQLVISKLEAANQYSNSAASNRYNYPTPPQIPVYNSTPSDYSSYSNSNSMNYNSLDSQPPSSYHLPLDQSKAREAPYRNQLNESNISFGITPSNSKSSMKSLSSMMGEVNDVRKSVSSNLQSSAANSNSYNTPSSGRSNESSSLSSLLQSKGGVDSNGDRRKSMPLGKVAAPAPFATDKSSREIMSHFESLERDLTRLMSEKNNLQDEGEKLHQRGLKTLRERSRLQQVEMRLEELGKDISSLRQQLSSKPG